ncbi:MAG: O-antigen ligase family protein [Myxococcales bacterium]|nr:O-antigen ligase family protein [Myxococcales bacterium]
MLVILLTIALAIGGLAAIAFGQPKLLAAALVGPPVLWLAIRRPIYAFGAVVVVSGWNKALGGGGLMLTPYKLGLIALLGLGVFRVGSGVKLRAVDSWLALPLLLTTMLVAISELASDFPMFDTPMALGGVALTVIMARQLVTDISSLRSLAVVLIIGQFWMAAHVWNEVGWSALQSMHVIRAGGIANQPNKSISLSMVWLFPTLFLIFDAGTARWQRWLAVSGAPAFVYVLFATASRGGSIAAIAGILTFTAAMIFTSKRLVPALAVVGVVTVFAINLAPESYTRRMTGTVQVDRDTGQAVKVKDSHRRELALESLSQIAERPVLGGGRAGVALLRGRDYGRVTVTHSTYLRTADSYGIPALLLLLYLYFRGQLAAIRTLRSTDPTLRLYGAGLVAGITAFAVNAIASSAVVQKEAWFLFVLAAISESLRPQREGESASETGVAPSPSPAILPKIQPPSQLPAIDGRPT